jgi:hypothetical protein
MTDNLKTIVIEERLARGLDVSAADLEFLARRKRKRSGEGADDSDDGVQTCPVCGGSGKVRGVPDDDDQDDDEKEASSYGYEEDD